MIPVNTRGDLAPAPIPAPPQPIENPAPPVPIAPQMQTVRVPDDPRGTKRRREEESPEAGEPALKLARAESSDEEQTSDEESEVDFDDEQELLVYLIQSGYAERVGELLKKSPKLREAHDAGEDGFTPLCLAASLGYFDIVHLLVSAGCDTNTPSGNGTTPLICAVQQCNVKMIVELCKLGANLYFINPKTGWDALASALVNKHLDSCKALITEGADLCRILNISDGVGGQSIPSTPLVLAILLDFVELIDWWLDEKKLPADFWDPARNTSIANVAVANGSLAVIRSLVKRGANLTHPPFIVADNQHLRGPWAIARHFKQYHVIEYLVNEGIPVTIEAPTNSSLSPDMLTMQRRLTISEFCHWFGWGVMTDLYIHLPTQVTKGTRADRVTVEQLWRHPERAIEQLARFGVGISDITTNAVLTSWCDLGLLGVMLVNNNFIEMGVRAAQLLGPTITLEERFTSGRQTLEAQQTQILVELLSEELCSPSWPQRFSGLKLTAKGEQIMNQIAVAQGELMLKGIANLRARFERQVASLPDICMNIYISRTNQLNEADLNRRITGEWGLYEPIARAVIRLVKVSYEKLCAPDPARVTPEFAVRPLEEQLRHVIVDTLEEWDKIPEIVETLLKCDASVLDFVSNLLFQQWRLVGEAFGVTKPRYSQFGPRPLSSSDSEPVIQGEPVMEVDEAPALAVSSREYAMLPQ